MAGTDSPSVISGRNPIAYSTSDPLALFIVQLLIIVCLCRLLHVFIRRLYQPSVISEIIGGILLGPTVLGRWKAFADNVFPKESLTNLNLVANFGLMLFLFMVGLELDPRILKRNFHRSLAISAAGIILPFGLGTATSYALYTILMDSEGTFSTFLLFCGVAMAITAFPVLARILTEQNLLKTTVGSIAISAAAIDDVISWCLLALVLALTNNSSGLSALWVFLVGAGWTIFVLLVVRPVYIWYLRRSGVLRGREPTQMVLFTTFVMVLISAYFTDIIGIHAIFGAFIIGIIVPHDGGFAIKVTEKLEDTVQIFFLPIYFALSGLKTNLSDLNDGKTWGLLVLICVVAFIGKIVGCSVAARFSKFTWRESLTIGFLMNCKGLVELIVLNIGLQAGVINTKIFTMMVVKALVTTFVTTPVVVRLYPPEYQMRIDDQGHEGDEEAKIDRSGANAGPPVSVLVVLSRIQQVPSIMTLLGYLHNQPDVSAVRKLAAPGTDADADAGMLATIRSGIYRPIRVFGLRLLEHTGRDSSVMQHYESAAQVATDPVMAMFRAFARVAHMAFHAALAYSDREHFVDNILNSAQDADAELTIVSAFGRNNNSSSSYNKHDIAASAAIVQKKLDKSTDAMTPGWFEGMGWGFSTEQQATLITTLFSKARNHVCVFIDCGLADSSDAAQVPDEEFAKALDGGTDKLPVSSGTILQAAQPSTVPGGVADDADPVHSDAPGAPAAQPADERRVPVVVVPFFGGPDDRQALRLAADLCTHAAVRIVVWRFVKSSRPSSRDIVLNEAQYPAQPNIPQTPAAVRLHASDGSEVNPWELALGDDINDAKQRALAVAETRVDDDISLNEAAEREEDEAFIGAHLQPSDGAAPELARESSGADNDGSTPLALAQTATRDTSASVYADGVTPRDGDGDASGGRSGIRQKITQRLRFRRQGSPSADSTRRRSGWDDTGNRVSTLTEGERTTRFPNMTIKTTVTATPLQTLLLHSRTLRASDLIICGRSVRVSLPYFNNALELQAYTPAGHAHTRGERQRALGTAVEYLLGFGTSASILVIQAGHDPHSLEGARSKRIE